MPVGADILVPFAVFLLIAGIGAAAASPGRRERTHLRARLAEIREGRAAPAETAEPREGALSRLFSKIGAMPALGGPSPKLRKTLAQAGYTQRGAAEIFFGMKVVAALCGLGIGGAVAVEMSLDMTKGLFAVVGGMGLGSMIPGFLLGRRVKARTDEIRTALPNAIDLLEVCVSAGMGVDQAWNATADEIREASPALADEMALANFEMLLGARRTEALRNMADRTGADDLSALSSIISQADRFGTSMADALRTFAETMRESRSQKAEEAAERMAIKLMLPMVIFIFPVVMLVSAGPAALKMVEMFSE